MRPDGKRLVDNLPTPRAFLRGVGRVHSNDLMSSTLSLGSENIEERAPGGIHDAFCQMMILDHIADLQVLNGNMVMGLSVLLGNLVVEVSTLPLDLEMGLRRALGCFTTTLRPLLSTCYRALLASKCGLTLAVVVGALDGVPFAIGQEGFQPYVNTNIRMVARAWGMLLLWFRFTDKQSIPMPISAQDQMSRLGHSFHRTVQLDFDGATQLLGKGKMLATLRQREIDLVLSQLYGMPPIRCLEPWEAYISKTRLTGGKKPFKGLTEPIREHLDGRSRNMFPTTCKVFVQIVFCREGAILLVLCLESREHLIVEVTRLDQAPHEQVTLLLSRIDAVLKRFHTRYFPRSQVNCQVVEVVTQPSLPQTGVALADMPPACRAQALRVIPVTEVRGFTGWFDNSNYSGLLTTFGGSQEVESSRRRR
jgi:hypothetical protein